MSDWIVAALPIGGLVLAIVYIWVGDGKSRLDEGTGVLTVEDPGGEWIGTTWWPHHDSSVVDASELDSVTQLVS